MDDNDPILNALADVEESTATEEIEPVVETEDQEEVEETPEEQEESEDGEAESEAEQPEEDTEDLQPEVDPKEEARRRYEERQKAIQERNTRIQEQNEQYVNEATDEYDQRLRQIEINDYIRSVEQTEQTIVNEFERVKANPNLQIFNPDNKELFNQKAYDKAMRDYNAGYINWDKNGNMIGVKGSLYEHLTETAELLQGAVKTGAVQQVRAARKMKATADSKPAATPKEAPKDAILDILKSD